jgi:hypothetical protein
MALCMTSSSPAHCFPGLGGYDSLPQLSSERWATLIRPVEPHGAVSLLAHDSLAQPVHAPFLGPTIETLGSKTDATTQ